jgi:hypothetical protein
MSGGENRPELSELALRILKRIADGPTSGLELLVEFGKEPEFKDAMDELVNYEMVKPKRIVLN